MINVCRKVKFLFKDDPKVTDSVTEDKKRKGIDGKATLANRLRLRNQIN